MWQWFRSLISSGDSSGESDTSSARSEASATDSSPTANPGYAVAQMARTLRTSLHHPDPATRERARERVRSWEAVLEGMLSGRLDIGSRTPVDSLPPWATLEVATGGFATGAPLAGGPLQPHEKLWIEQLELPADDGAREAINAHFLSHEGQQTLRDMLRSGRYRIAVPEEGALLVVAWLLEHGEPRRAERILESLAPWLGQLRFYPAPASRPAPESDRVHLQPVAKTIENLLDQRQPLQELAQRETLQVWHPLFDRILALFVETVEGPMPRVERDPNGDPIRHDDGSWKLTGGWPCQHYPQGWHEQARQLLDEYRALRKDHRLCRRPERPGGNLSELRQVLERCVDNPEHLSGREVGRVRRVIALVEAKRGLPGSAATRSLRTEQALLASRPTKQEVAAVLADRLRPFPADRGLTTVEPLLAPINADEAASHRLPSGWPVPTSLRPVVLRSLEAPLEDLIEVGVLSSGDMIAEVIPRLVAEVAAAGFPEPSLRRLHRLIHEAFQQRRSVLLFNLERQVQTYDLPWLAEMERFRTSTGDQRDEAQALLERLVLLTLSRFPEAIVPNKLLRGLRVLIDRAGLDLPLVDELAADIFMGTFSAKFLRATQRAGQLLTGSLYERYYGIDYGRVVAIDDVGRSRYAAATSPAFAALCTARAGVSGEGRWSVAQNGMIIEQAQILTTQNLAVFASGLGLTEELHHQGSDLARRCFGWIVRRLERDRSLKVIKNAAYAWRQMVFFLSLSPPESAEELIAWAEDHLSVSETDLRERLRPVLEGLTLAVKGGSLDNAPAGLEIRRFLGWTTDFPHWLQKALR